MHLICAISVPDLKLLITDPDLYLDPQIENQEF